jgi:hypothetical protein
MKRVAVSAVKEEQTDLAIEAPVETKPPPPNVPVHFRELLERLQAALSMHGRTAHAVEHARTRLPWEVCGYDVLEVELRDNGKVTLLKDFVGRCRELGVLEDCEAPQIPGITY